MKILSIIAATACGVFTERGIAQSFQNLNFESATLAPILQGQFGGAVSSTNAIPGWTAYLGQNQTTQVLQNNYTLGNASVDILGPNWSFGGIIEGRYTLVLQPGAGGGQGTNISASVSQTGLIPIGVQSIQLKASVSSPFVVSLGGQNLSLAPLTTGSNYMLYGADISSFAGQIEALTITALPAPNTTDYFDSIVFSTQPIPEPNSLSLLSLGGFIVSLVHRRRLQP